MIMALAEQLIHLIHLGSLAGGIAAFVWYQEYYYHQKVYGRMKKKLGGKPGKKVDGKLKKKRGVRPRKRPD